MEKTNDNRILAVAKNIALRRGNERKWKTGILVSKDALLRVKADALGLHAEDFLSDRVVELDHLYTGINEMHVDIDKIGEFYEKGQLIAGSQ